MADPRFSAIYDSHVYNIDPSAKEYKKTQGMEAVIKEKIKRRTDDVTDGHSVKKRKKAVNKDNSETGDLSVEKATHKEGGVKDASLASLVKSVKAKTHNFKSKMKRWQEINEPGFLFDAHYMFRPQTLLWYEKLSRKRAFHVFYESSHCKIKRTQWRCHNISGRWVLGCHETHIVVSGTAVSNRRNFSDI